MKKVHSEVIKKREKNVEKIGMNVLYSF